MNDNREGAIKDDDVDDDPQDEWRVGDVHGFYFIYSYIIIYNENILLVITFFLIF